MNENRWTVALVCAFALSVGNGTIAAAQGNAAGDALTVGFIDSQTGPVAVAGNADVCGAWIAVDAINAGGGVNGKPLGLTVADDQSRPAVAAQAASRLTGNGIKFFAGGSISSTVLAALPILKDAGALSMGGTTKAAQFFQSGALAIRLNSDNDQDGASIAGYASKVLHAKSIAFVALQGAYGEGALESIKAGLGPNSKITRTFFTPQDATNFQSIVTSIAAEKPDAVVFAIFGDAQPISFMRQYKQAGITAPLIAAAGVLTSSLVRVAGGAAEGVVSADLWVSELDDPANRTMIAAFDKYKAAHRECADKPIDKQVVVSYGQVLLLAQAIDKTKSTDPKTVRDTIMANTWDLPQGNVSFLSTGQAKVSYDMLVGKGDRVVLLKP